MKKLKKKQVVHTSPQEPSQKKKKDCRSCNDVLHFNNRRVFTRKGKNAEMAEEIMGSVSSAHQDSVDFDALSFSGVDFLSSKRCFLQGLVNFKFDQV